MINDAKTGIMSLRAHGTFSYRLDNPKRLWGHIPNDSSILSTDDLIGHLRSLILEKFSNIMTKEGGDITPLIYNRDFLSGQIQSELYSSFKEQGLILESFLIQSISFPEGQSNTVEIFMKLEKLNQLYQQGVVNEDEYNTKKKQLLKDI